MRQTIFVFFAALLFSLSVVQWKSSYSRQLESWRFTWSSVGLLSQALSWILPLKLQLLNYEQHTPTTVSHDSQLKADYKELLRTCKLEPDPNKLNKAAFIIFSGYQESLSQPPAWHLYGMSVCNRSANRNRERECWWS